MANVPVEEQLGFDISGALQGISQIDDALTQVVQTFSVGLASALETLTGLGSDVPSLAESLDVAGLGPAVDAALSEATASVPIDADTEGLTNDIDAAIEPQTLEVDADTSAVESDIAALDTTISVPIEGDASDAQAAIDALEGETVTIAIEADTGGAQEALGALTGTAAAAGSSLVELGGAVGGAGALAALGRGQIGGLTSGLGFLGAGAIASGLSVSSVAASVGVFFSQALEAEAAVQRLNASMGPLASRIETLQVGNLNADLSELAVSLGSDDDALRNIAATFFNFQEGAGTAAIEASKFSETVLALSARAVALNPALGSVEAVAGRLGNVLGRGGRFASQFGIDLTSAEIKARAAENATKGLGDGVSFAALQIAGAQLAIEQYGDSLTEDIAEGTKNPIIQLAALRQKFSEATEAIGAPLVAPILGLLTEIEPLAEGVAAAIGGLGRIAVPAVQALVTVLVPAGPLLNAFASGLGTVATSLEDLPPPLVAAGIAFGALAIAGTAAARAFVAAGLVFTASPFGAAVVGITTLITAVGAFSGEAKEAAVDTSSLNTAFGQASSGGDEFANTLSGLDRAIEDYLDKQLQIGDVGERAIDATNRLGISTDTLREVLTSSDADFARFRDNLFTVDNESQTGKAALDELYDTIKGGREALQASAAGALAAAVANGALTQSEVDLAVATHTVTDEQDDGTRVFTDFITVVDQFAPKIDRATAAQVRAARATAIASGSYLNLANEIAAGTITTADAATVAQDLGIAEADATQVIQDQLDAITDQNDRRIEATDAARRLRSELASGTITAAEAQIGFLQLGISVRGTAELLDEGTAAAEEHARALTEQADKQQLATDSAQRLRAQLATGQITAREAEASFIAMGVSVEGAKGAIDETTEAMDRFVSEGVGQLGDAGESIATFSSDLTSAIEGVAAAVASSEGTITEEVLRAQDEVVQALNPQKMIDALNLQIVTITTFQENIRTLIERGRTSTAAALIAQGPGQGGFAAEAFANDDTAAVDFEAGQRRAAQTTAGYEQFLINSRPRLTGVLVTLADGSVVDAATLVKASGEQLGQDFVDGIAKPITASTFTFDGLLVGLGSETAGGISEAAAQARTAAEQAGREAQTGFTTGFVPDQIATTQVGKIPAAITGNIQPAVSAASTAALAVTLAFASGLSFDDAASQAIGFVAGSLTADDQALAAAAGAGFSLGQAFAGGFAGGLSYGSSAVSEAAGALASTADAAVRRRLGIASPSRAGITIGEQYVAGIAQGLANLTPVQAATAALTLALVPNLAPTLAQVPSLAPGIVAASPQAARTPAASVSAQDAAAVSRRVESTIILNKTDPDPKHFADELAWTIQ